MAKRKSTIRKMRGMPVSRELYHMIAELDSLARRLDRYAQKVEEIELEANAEHTRHKKSG
jgi:hypothetical protein